MRFGKRKSYPDSGYVLTYERSQRTTEAVMRSSRYGRRFGRRKLALSVLMAFLLLSSGVATASASTATTESANANLFAEIFCMRPQQDDEMTKLGWSDNPGGWNTKEGKDKGYFNNGANRFAMLLGKTQGFSDIQLSTEANGIAISGQNAQQLGTDRANTLWATATTMTAYEKYGVYYPQFTSWTPAFYDQSGGDKGVSFYGFNTSSKEIAKKEHFTPNTTSGPSSLSTGDKDGTKAADGLLVTSDLLTCMNFGGNIQSEVAQAFTVIPRAVFDWAVSLYGMVMGGTSLTEDGSPLKPIGDALERLLNGADGSSGLIQMIFLPFIAPMIVLGAGWVLWNGIVKRRFSLATGNVVWMIVAVAAATMFFVKPLALTDIIETGVSTIVEGAQDGIITQAANANGNNKDLPDMCPSNLGDGANLSEFGLPSLNAVARKGQCYAWYVGLYSPWVQGQFGVELGAQDGVLTQDPRGILNSSQAEISYGSSMKTNAKTWPQFQVDRQATTQRLQVSEVAYAQLSHDGGALNPAWQTGGIMGAINMNFMLFILSAVFFVYGFSMLGLILTEIIIILGAPFFFIAGIIPQWGMRKVLRVAEILISVFVKRIILSFALILFLALMMIAQSMEQSGIIKLIFIVAIAGFFIFAKDKMVGYFTDDIHFGGDGRANFGQQGVNAAGATAVGLAGAGITQGVQSLLGSNKEDNAYLQDSEQQGHGTAPAGNGLKPSVTSDVSTSGLERKQAERNAHTQAAEAQPEEQAAIAKEDEPQLETRHAAPAIGSRHPGGSLNEDSSEGGRQGDILGANKQSRIILSKADRTATEARTFTELNFANMTSVQRKDILEKIQAIKDAKRKGDLAAVEAGTTALQEAVRVNTEQVRIFTTDRNGIPLTAQALKQKQERLRYNEMLGREGKDALPTDEVSPSKQQKTPSTPVQEIAKKAGVAPKADSKPKPSEIKSPNTVKGEKNEKGASSAALGNKAETAKSSPDVSSKDVPSKPSLLNPFSKASPLSTKSKNGEGLARKSLDELNEMLRNNQESGEK